MIQEHPTTNTTQTILAIMFKKKNRLRKYKFLHGRRPTKKLVQGYNRIKPIKRTHPIVKKIKKLSLLIIILFCIILLIYLIGFSSYFEISKIEISGENTETEGLNDQITNSLSEEYGKNLAFLDTEIIQEKILTNFPELEEVEINKNYPDALVINFIEYPLVANIINESDTVKKTYIVNSIGYAIKEDYEKTNLPYIYIKSEEPANPENAIIEASKLKYILDSATYFEDKFGLQVTQIQYKPIPREVHLLTEKNFYIWLDIQVPFEDQLKKLKKAIVKLDIYNEPLQYIDLRIVGNNGNKIIYRRQ